MEEGLTGETTIAVKALRSERGWYFLEMVSGLGEQTLLATVSPAGETHASPSFLTFKLVKSSPPA